ncbi:YjzC family protein [Paenibacillus sp. KN14-4R]|uniref:YjzC family protein n=1 Tax=Paenibacillus sp. KN14-4R TaxID=3445773 RepID=UPI003FA0EBC7
MGERTEFRPGEKVPTDGQYMEIGENDFHMGIQNPQVVTLERGDEFPNTTNHNRKWTKKTIH